MTREIKKYAYIDALRGFAIVAVVMVHSSQFVTPISRTLKILMYAGAHGVQLFYITSAMTLCMSLASRIPRENFWLRNFFIRRFFRIAPMFYIAVIGYSLLYSLAPRLWAPDGIKWWYIPLTGAFLHGFLPETINSVVPGGWSIAVEFNFYLLLPVLFLLLKNRAPIIAFTVLSMALYWGSMILLQHFLSPHYPTDQQYLVTAFCHLNILSQLPVFSLGLLAYHELKANPKLKTTVTIGWLIFLTSLLALMTAGAHVSRTDFYESWSDTYFSCGLTLFALTLASLPFAFIVNGVLIQIGKLSYSMYLTHFAVIDGLIELGWQRRFATGDLSSLCYFLLVLCITAGVSYCTYTLIERPGIRLGNLLMDSLGPVRGK